MSRYFNINRFMLILKRELKVQKTSMLIVFSSLTLISLLIALMPQFVRIGNNTSWEHAKYFPNITALFLIAIAGNCFSELNFSDRKIEFLMLPASTLEKYLTKFLYTTLIFFLISAAALILSGLIIKLWNPELKVGEHLFKDIFTSWNNVSMENIWTFSKQVLLLHSLFFFGAVYFKKMEPAKTILSTVGLVVTIFLLNYLLHFIPPFNKIPRIIDYSWADGHEQYVVFPLSRQSMVALSDYAHSYKNFIDFIFQYVLTLLLWVLSFLRLKEAEVNDGV